MDISDKISKWLTLGTALIALFAGYQSYITKNVLDKFEQKNTQFKFTKDSSDFVRDREFKFKIYDLVTEAISKKEDTLKQKTATIVVDELLISEKDKSFKLALLNIIRSASSNSNVKKEASIAIFNVEESQKNTFENQVENKSTPRIDVFYLEDTQQYSKDKAKQLADLLSGKYDVRVRLLPTSVNKRIGYRLGNNQIRFEVNESVEVQKIKSIIKSGMADLKIMDKNTTTQTPNYISVFIVN
jgi:hypothetical protein